LFAYTYSRFLPAKIVVDKNVDTMLHSYPMSLYLRGSIWWSRIEVDGSVHQFSTKMRSKHQARAIEAAKRTDLVKGLAGLSAPTLNEFVTRFVNALPGRVSKQTFMFYVRRLHLSWILPLCATADLIESNPR
jgi:hypothetical protein